ncbi:DegQ family serine endoprotease [bacterium]|nr:DegQ family serine endoprotease [bacterium]
MIRVVLMVFLSFLWVSGASADQTGLASLRNLGNDFANIVKDVSPAVVFIKVEQRVDNQSALTGGGAAPNDPFGLFNDEFMRRFFGPQYRQRQVPQQQQQVVVGQGSGFIMSADGYILTNNHVAGKADKISVKLEDGREFDAKLIGTDAHSDVAVIKINAKNLPVLSMGNSDDLKVGEWVLAIGNPFGLSHTVTAGIVSAKGRSSIGIADYEDFIQTDAAINPGNSGGPLVNLDGKVVGINTAIFSRSGGYMGIGFTIPINMVKTIRDQLIADGKVTRGYLGVSIQDITPELAKSFGLKTHQGIVVADVMKNSPADKSGLKRSDVLLELNGKAIQNVAKFRNQIALFAPGKGIQLTIWRQGKQQTLSVTIEKRPETEQVSSKGIERLEKLGLALTPLTPQLSEQLGYQGENGVLIAAVQDSSVAALSGLRPGMLIQEINQKPVSSVEEVLQVLPETGNVLLLVRQGQQVMFVTFSLNP